jgi:hypothetical protein
VMVAPVIASGELQADRPARAPRPRRRRSSVYDADGNEVFITLLCQKCRKMRPLSQFGLRKMADGAIRNQPWCRSCRSGAGAQKARGQEEAAVSAGPSPTAGSRAASGTAATDPKIAGPAAQPASASSVAAQVAAALVWGK